MADINNTSFFRPIWLLLLPLLLATGALHAETRLHITTGFTPPVSDFFESVLGELDQLMPKVSITFEVLPAERSLILANQGINDGECCRIADVIQAEYGKLLPVESSFFSARFNAFGKIKRPINSFEDLKPYTVGSVEGWKIAVNKVNEINAKETHIVTTPEQLFQMIKENRLDYGVVGHLSGLQTIHSLNLSSEIHAIEPPLIEKELRLFLHEKHQYLIPAFNEAIQQLIQDGTIDRLYTQLLESL